MKKVLYIFTSVITCVALCTAMISCDIETSDNGNLDGFWQLTQIDSVAINKSVSMKESQIFWAFQTDVMEVRNLKAGDTKVLRRLEISYQSTLLILKKIKTIENCCQTAQYLKHIVFKALEKPTKSIS